MEVHTRLIFMSINVRHDSLSTGKEKPTTIHLSKDKIVTISNHATFSSQS